MNGTAKLFNGSTTRNCGRGPDKVPRANKPRRPSLPGRRSPFSLGRGALFQTRRNRLSAEDSTPTTHHMIGQGFSSMRQMKGLIQTGFRWETVRLLYQHRLECSNHRIGGNDFAAAEAT